jgi:SAM-dependent methyltransferase
MGELTEGQRLWWEVQKTVNRLLSGRTSIRVLEAGCGSTVHFSFPVPCHLTGMDISRRQLERHAFLEERIVGDLQTYELPAESFDAVVCWNVLEHLRHPEAAVSHLAAAIRPEGILVLACPNPYSFKGLGARLTPHWFHVWFYRAILGLKEAGSEDLGPFRTVMSFRIAPRPLCALAESCGLTVELCMVSRGSRWCGRNSRMQRSIEWFLDVLAAALRVVTFGKFRGELAETRLVLRKPGATP